MPKSGKEIIAILKKNGWEVKAQKGSHVKLQNGSSVTVVPLHGNKDLGRGLVTTHWGRKKMRQNANNFLP